MATPQIEGKKVPDVVFKTRVRDESIGGDNPYRWQDVTTTELFGGKKIVLFALPGAFTPTCDALHLPGYERLYEEFKAAGVDDVYCLSVNDAFVMNRWGKSLDVQKVKLIPDGSTFFTKGMGMLVRKDDRGFGERSWRYSAFIEDGVVTKAFIEEGFEDNHLPDPFEVSNAETILNFLKNNE